MESFKFITGYIPGVIGRVAELHALYYSEKWNFGKFFETKVAIELSEFLNNYNEKKIEFFHCLLMEELKVQFQLTVHQKMKI
ncbi:MAG: hypothetical protein U9R02_14290 [Thermodesulfobacteriota bacterium]|nr:hypothetical protein [Thermodesulfobacteriota bacterium]